MERTIRIKTEIAEDKFRLVENYRGVGVYQEVTPNGYYVHQSYGFKIKDKFFVSYSFMNNDKEDIFDYIDRHYEGKPFGFKAFNKGDYYCIHTNGNLQM